MEDGVIGKRNVQSYKTNVRDVRVEGGGFGACWRQVCWNGKFSPAVAALPCCPILQGQVLLALGQDAALLHW